MSREILWHHFFNIRSVLLYYKWWNWEKCFCFTSDNKKQVTNYGPNSQKFFLTFSRHKERHLKCKLVKTSHKSVLTLNTGLLMEQADYSRRTLYGTKLKTIQIVFHECQKWYTKKSGLVKKYLDPEKCPLSTPTCPLSTSYISLT